MKEINAEDYNELLNSEAPVVIDFHATWCGPCKVLSPILEELSDEVAGVEFVKLDVDQHPEIAGANGVMGVPTVVMLKGGEVKERFVGVQPKEVIKEVNKINDNEICNTINENGDHSNENDFTNPTSILTQEFSYSR